MRRLFVLGAGLAAVAVVAVLLVVLLAGRPDPRALGTAAAARTATSGTTAVMADPRRAATSAALSARRRDPLGTAAARYLAGRSGIVLAAVEDLGTRQTWTLGSGGGSGAAQAEASIVKIDIIEALYAQQPDGLSAAEQVLAQQMIEDSDNDAATALWDAAGGASGIHAFNDDAGLTRTTMSSCVQCPGFPWPGWGLSTTTPLDQLTLLRDLVEPGDLLSSRGRAAVLGLMKHVTADQRWGVTGGVPAGVTVAVKNGWLPLNAADTDWQINSVGWISGRGRDYLIAVLSTGNPTETYGIDTIDGLSSIVWNRLG
jgi:Beta-lactamase enzyme family